MKIIEESEEFIEKKDDDLYWYHISMNETLSEEFIERNSDKVNWYNISISQKLSEEFIGK